MTLRHLQIFRALCENDYNTTRTAETLNMTQPAVSLALKELESYYGINLFDRLGRRLKITDAGLLFLQYAVNITDQFTAMETELRDWGTKGILRVGASITIGSRFLPSYVKAFMEAFPQAEVRATVEQAERLEKKILDNELDLALTEGVAHDGRIKSIPFMNDSLSVIAPRDSGWHTGDTIKRNEFLRQPFLLREKGSGTRETFFRTMEEEGMHVTPVWESMSTTALINAVRNSLGIAVLPSRLTEESVRRGDVVEVKVEGLEFRRKFYIIHHRNKFLTPKAEKFISICLGEES